MNLVFSSVFESDLAELSGYFAERGGVIVSTRFETAIFHIAELLLKNPEMGRLRQDLNPDTIRSIGVPQFRNYILFYRLSSEDLIFMRLRFGGIDLPSLFQS